MCITSKELGSGGHCVNHGGVVLKKSNDHDLQQLTGSVGADVQVAHLACFGVGNQRGADGVADCVIDVSIIYSMFPGAACDPHLSSIA